MSRTPRAENLPGCNELVTPVRPKTLRTHALREATSRDASFVLDLARKFSNQVGFIPTAAMLEAIQRSNILLVCENSEPAGYLLLRPKLSCSPLVRPISQAAVAMDAQRRGAGLQLVEAAAAAAAEDGQSLLQCWCRADLDANDFWAAAGFVKVATRTTANARRQPLILWRRPIVPLTATMLHNLPARAGHRAGRCTNARPI